MVFKLPLRLNPCVEVAHLILEIQNGFLRLNTPPRLDLEPD